jgi:4a-hydroxytetrahydrobiopterin dehydratase
MSSDLQQKKCIPCEGGVPALTKAQAEDIMMHVPDWELSEDGTKITRLYGFKDFAKALAFTNAVGKVAEEEWHHPDIKLSWGKVEVTFTTHAVRGLTENDFIMAAKVNELPA